MKLVRGEQHLDIQLLRRLQEFSVDKVMITEQFSSPRRTASELLAAAGDKAKQRQERERKEAEEARIRHLKEIAPREPQLWEEVYALIEKKQVKAYDEAVELLIQLREFDEYLGRMNAFKSQRAEISERYHNRPALVSRLGTVRSMKDKR